MGWSGLGSGTAVRDKTPLIIGLASPSGAGKTYSAFRIASGITGGKPFGVIDTESGRAKHYAPKEGRPPKHGQFLFKHGLLSEPFHPEAYLSAIRDVEQAGYEVMVVDSMSHEWCGYGGVLDMHEKFLNDKAGDSWERRNRWSAAAWAYAKAPHKKMIQALLQLRCHLILCFRAEEKLDFSKKKADGGYEPKRLLSGYEGMIPLTDPRLLFEMTCSFELSPKNPGVPIPIKLEEQLKPCFNLKGQLDQRCGELLASWARGEEIEAPGERTEASSKRGAPASPQSAGCPECGRSPCDPDCSLQGAQPPLELDQKILHAIKAKVGTLAPIAREAAEKRLRDGAVKAVENRNSVASICSAIEKWEPESE